MTSTCVAVFGGTGFLGRAIVSRMAATGANVRVAVRNPRSLKLPDVAVHAGRIASTYADVRDETSVGRALEGCDAAVNAVGHYVERGDATQCSGALAGVKTIGVSDLPARAAAAALSSTESPCQLLLSSGPQNLSGPSLYRARRSVQGHKRSCRKFEGAAHVRPSLAILAELDASSQDR